MVQSAQPSSTSRLVIVDPGHFHATLLQKEMYPDLDPEVSVYGRLGPELVDYLNRISAFNNRRDSPTRWRMSVHTSDDPMGEMLRRRAGNIVVFTGRNRGKIDKILAALNAGLNVIADKPWVIAPADLPKLEQALSLAEHKGLVAYDIMTERYEVSCQVQRELVNTPELFGRQEAGTVAEPGIRARSVHHVMKTVAGLPLQRPSWFFDIDEYGEGLADVGTHVVDLVQWTAFPDQAIDYRRDIVMLSGRRWPLDLSRADFQKITGETQFPPALTPHVSGDALHYMCNNAVEYTLRGVHVKLDILWNREAAEGGDVYEAMFRGSRARIEIRQGKAEKYVPEVYVVAVDPARAGEVMAAARKKAESLQSQWPSTTGS